MGELVILKARLTWVGRSSMEVMVKVYAENIKSGKTALTNKAFLTFVALDDNCKPTPVPSLHFETEEEKKIAQAAEIRHLERLKRKSKEE
jgi:acyl-CoA hydrolase